MQIAELQLQQPNLGLNRPRIFFALIRVLNQDDLQLNCKRTSFFVLLSCIHLATTLMIEQEYLHAFNVINLQATRPAYKQLAVLRWSELCVTMGTIIAM